MSYESARLPALKTVGKWSTQKTAFKILSFLDENKYFEWLPVFLKTVQVQKSPVESFIWTKNCQMACTPCSSQPCAQNCRNIHLELMSPKALLGSPQRDNPFEFPLQAHTRKFLTRRIPSQWSDEDTASFVILKVDAVHSTAEVPHLPALPEPRDSERLDHRGCVLEGKSTWLQSKGALPPQCSLKLHIQHQSPYTTLPAVLHWQWCEPALPGGQQGCKSLQGIWD